LEQLEVYTLARLRSSIVKIVTLILVCSPLARAQNTNPYDLLILISNNGELQSFNAAQHTHY